MVLAITFFIGLVVSYVVSIPVGAVNMAVVQATINQGKRAGYLLGLGAIVSEAIYCAVPLFGLNLLLEDSGVYEIMYLVFIPVMVFLGIYSIVNRHKNVSPKARKERKTSNNFLYGMFLCASNPMTLVFWTQTTVYLKQNAWITDDIPILVAFLVGVPTGTFLLYFTFVEIAWRTGQNMGETARANVNLIIGLIFILLAAYLLYVYLSGSGQSDDAAVFLEGLGKSLV